QKNGQDQGPNQNKDGGKKESIDKEQKKKLSDWCKDVVKKLQDENSQNNSQIEQDNNKIKDLESRKITKEQEELVDKTIDDASAGDPDNGKTFGRLARHAMIYRENQRIDKTVEKIKTQITSLQKSNIINQEIIKEYSRFIISTN
ncbi:MAG: hypothetical protein ABUT20_43145, partial [Bacteroidota bacterium]